MMCFSVGVQQDEEAVAQQPLCATISNILSDVGGKVSMMNKWIHFFAT